MLGLFNVKECSASFKTFYQMLLYLSSRELCKWPWFQYRPTLNTQDGSLASILRTALGGDTNKDPWHVWVMYPPSLLFLLLPETRVRNMRIAYKCFKVFLYICSVVLGLCTSTSVFTFQNFNLLKLWTGKLQALENYFTVSFKKE